MIMIEITIVVMMDSANSMKVMEIRANSMMAMAKMKMAAMEMQANAILVAMKIVAKTNTNSLMAVVPASKEGSME